MMHRNGEEYGDGVLWAEEGSGSFFHLMEGNVLASILNGPQNFRITVYVKVRQIKLFFQSFVVILIQWDNVNGALEEFSEDDKKWILKVREAVGEDEIVDYPPGYTAQDLGQFLDKC